MTPSLSPSRGKAMVLRAGVREGEIKTPMEEVTSLTSNTIFQLVREKELFCCRLSFSHIKTNQGRYCL